MRFLVFSPTAVSGTVFVVLPLILNLAQVEVHYITGDQRYKHQQPHRRQDCENARLAVGGPFWPRNSARRPAASSR